MKRIEFYGSSDNLIEVDGDIPGCDEYNGEAAIFEICGLQVEVDFMINGCWGIRVTQLDESVPVTANNLILVSPPHLNYPSYSMRLRMDVPDDATVKKVGTAGE